MGTGAPVVVFVCRCELNTSEVIVLVAAAAEVGTKTDLEVDGPTGADTEADGSATQREEEEEEGGIEKSITLTVLAVLAATFDVDDCRRRVIAWTGDGSVGTFAIDFAAIGRVMTPFSVSVGGDVASAVEFDATGLGVKRNSNAEPVRAR